MYKYTSNTATDVPAVVTVKAGRVDYLTAIGTSNDFYTITGNLSNSKGTVHSNGLTLTQRLKIESAEINAISPGGLNPSGPQNIMI